MAKKKKKLGVLDLFGMAVQLILAIVMLPIIIPAYLISLFSSKKPKKISDPELGKMLYIKDGKYKCWEIESVCEGFPIELLILGGDESGPSKKAREKYNKFKSNLEHYIKTSVPIINQYIAKYPLLSQETQKEVTIENWRQYFKLVCFSCEEGDDKSEEFEISFESNTNFWIYITIVYDGKKLKSHKHDT